MKALRYNQHVYELMNNDHVVDETADKILARARSRVNGEG